METYSVDEFLERWDELMDRVETGESIAILDDTGKKAVMMPVSDEFLRIHTVDNIDAQ